LAGALKTLTGDLLLRQSLRANARRLAKNSFSTEAMTESLLSMYKGMSNCEFRIANVFNQIGQAKLDAVLTMFPLRPLRLVFHASRTTAEDAEDAEETLSEQHGVPPAQSG